MNEIKRGRYYITQMSKKGHQAILTPFTNQEKLLLIFFDDYSSLLSKAKHKAFQGIKIKILGNIRNKE